LPQLGDILAAELFWTSLANVRFAPDSDRIADIAEGPNRARTGCEQSQQLVASPTPSNEDGDELA